MVTTKKESQTITQSQKSRPDNVIILRDFDIFLEFFTMKLPKIFSAKQTV